MQIFEITQRKQVNELLGAATALAGGIGKALASKAGQAATGIDPLAQEKSGGPNARMAAFKANEQVVVALAKQMQLAWAKTVQEFMSRSKDSTGAPVTKLTDLTPASFNTLEPQLITMINNAARVKDYKSIGQDAEDPTVKGAAQASVEAIDKGIKAIMAATTNPKINAQGLQAIWQEMVRDGIAPAQQIAQFDAGKTATKTPAGQKSQVQFTQDARGAWLANGIPLQAALKDPVVKQAWDDMQRTGA